ncbi:MAG: TIGR04013 family B12-binding domain/radical SAM domain-containing protein [Thermoprotei archaeon]|nr:MAG: TIGR04013 family B12-binding domain/radical SAM domain-containing protein [Thermoprotei archaeon]
MRLKLIFKYDPTVRNSIAYLLGSIEVNERLRELDITLSRDPKGDIVHEDDVINIVAYSLTTINLLRWLDEIKALVKLKKRWRNIVLIAGGPHPSGDPQGVLFRMGFDYVFIGEAERSLSEFLICLAEGKDPYNIEGIAYVEDGKVVINPPAKVENLDSYPPCSDRFHLYPPIEITRGCPWGCKYCQTPRIFGFTVRHRSIDYIVKYAIHYERCGMTHIRFISPNGFSYGSKDGRTPAPHKIRELLLRVKRNTRNLRVYLGTFPSEVRPDFVTRETLEAVHGLIANRRIAIGAQSGSERVLSEIGRGHTVEDIFRAVELVRDYGYIPYVDFLFGLPCETPQDEEMTAQVMLRLARMGAIIRGHTFMPLPGTPYANARPGRISPTIRRALMELKRMGRLEGEWEAQERLAQEISLLLSSTR